MLALRTPEEFSTRPEGGYVAGERWFYFAFDRSLLGFVLWGSPSRQDIEGLMRFMETELDRPKHAALADVQGVESIAPAAFEVIAAFFERHSGALSAAVSKGAIVRPRGFNGALASGFFATVTAPFEVGYFDQPGAALESLNSAEPEARARALALARAEVEGVPLLLRSLRLYVDTHEDPSLEDASAAMHVSARTLQRSLAGYGTSYVDEVQEARVRRAERLLLETDEPLTRIAFEVGCASPQHFSMLFKKRRGITPTEFRDGEKGRLAEAWKRSARS